MSSFDVQGISYYPYWSTSSTLENFKTSVTNMANTYVHIGIDSYLSGMCAKLTFRHL